MTRISKIFFAGSVLLLLTGVAVAGDFSMDPSTIGSTQGDITNVFGLTFLGVSNIQYTSGTGLNVGDQFLDNGDLVATGIKDTTSSLLPFSATHLDDKWELGAIFNGLKGFNSAIEPDGTIDFVFTPGQGSIDIYALNTSSANWQPVKPAVIAGATKVGSIALLGGSGSYNFTRNDGSVDLAGMFTSLPVAGFWDYLGLPINLNQTVFLALTDSNNNGVLGAPATITNFGAFFNPPSTPANSAPSNFFVSNDGSVTFALAPIPEPSTLILMGLGLIGVASAARRKLTK